MSNSSCCVYKHTAPNGKVYIGITSRKAEYRWKNGKGYLDNSHFTRAIEKYGWENFTHEILEDNLSREEACQKEQEYIKLYHSLDERFGYNKTSGGDGMFEFSQDTLEKMSKIQQERVKNPEYIATLSKRTQASYERNPERAIHHSEQMKEIWQSEEHQNKVKAGMQKYHESERYEEVLVENSQRMKKYWESEERRKELSVRSKEMWGNGEYKKNFMQHLSELQNDKEYRRKISEGQKRLWADEEYRKRGIERLIATAQTEEAKERRRKGLEKYVNDPEWMANFHEASKRQWENPERMESHKQQLRERWADPVQREKLIHNLKKAYENPQYREEVKQRLQKIAEKKKKLVLCIETNQTYNSLNEAARAIELKSAGAICRSCQSNGRASGGGFHWKYVEVAQNG